MPTKRHLQHVAVQSGLTPAASVVAAPSRVVQLPVAQDVALSRHNQRLVRTGKKARSAAINNLAKPTTTDMKAARRVVQSALGHRRFPG